MFYFIMNKPPSKEKKEQFMAETTKNHEFTNKDIKQEREKADDVYERNESELYFDQLKTRKDSIFMARKTLGNETIVALKSENMGDFYCNCVFVFLLYCVYCIQLSNCESNKKTFCNITHLKMEDPEQLLEDQLTSGNTKHVRQHEDVISVEDVPQDSVAKSVEVQVMTTKVSDVTKEKFVKITEKGMQIRRQHFKALPKKINRKRINKCVIPKHI